MKIIKYPDNTSYVELDWELEKEFIETEFRLNSYEDLWHLNQYCEILQRERKQVVITIPCLLDAQADRRFKEHQSSTLYKIAELLNEYKPDIGFKIFHPHNSEVVEALFDCVEIIDNSEFIKQILPIAEDNKKKVEKDCILMSSDAGGFKPLMKLCDKIQWQGETESASKSRKYENGKSILVQKIDRQDFQGKDILIIDDICVYGGTFKGLSKLLKERNCGKLYLAVSHMTVEILGEDPVTNYFDTVFTTNSKYKEYFEVYQNGKSGKPENLKIIKLFKE